jgi:hypothetical protein
MSSPRPASFATIAAAAALLASTSACTRIDTTEVHVRDPHAIGVVADPSNQWLLAPYSPSESVEVYRNFATKATLTRSPSGGIDYHSEHWALGKRLDTTALVDERGRVGWAGTPDSSHSLEQALQRGGEVRLYPVKYVNATGPFGTCNGTLFDSCIDNPAVRMSLAANSRDIDEVDIVRTPGRGLGVFETVFGALSLGVAATDGAFFLPRDPSTERNVALGVGAGLAVLGGVLLANGLWRLLTPEQRFVYRPLAHDAGR